jgi:hypothetical protein
MAYEVEIFGLKAAVHWQLLTYLTFRVPFHCNVEALDFNFIKFVDQVRTLEKFHISLNIINFYNHRTQHKIPIIILNQSY